MISSTSVAHESPARPRIVLFDSNIANAGFPFALVSITALLDTRRYDIRIITKRNCPDYENELLRACQGALCLAITSIIGKPVKHALRISRIVKAACPALPIIWGGWLPITLPDLCLAEPSVDYICTGQGERTFQTFIAMLESGDLTGRHAIPNLGFKDNGKPVLTPRAPLENINLLPDFNLDLIDWNQHLSASSLGRRGLSLHTSIGCPWRCGFCCEKHYCGRKWYGLAPDRIITFMKKVRERAEYDHLLYFDTNFFVDERRVAELCRLQIREGLALPATGANGRCNDLARYKEETWGLMREAGIRSVFLGVESASNETLRYMNKDVTVEQTLAVLARCAQFGIRPTLSMALGWNAAVYSEKGPDHAFREEFQETVRFLYHVRANVVPDFNAYVYLYNPLPCTSLHETAIRHGYKPPTGLDEWSRFDTHEPNAPWLQFNFLNRSRLHGLRNVLHKLGQDYNSYIRQLPSVLRWPASWMIKAVLPCAKLRLRTGMMAFPVEFILFEKVETVFRRLNERLRLIALHGRD